MGEGSEEGARAEAGLGLGLRRPGELARRVRKVQLRPRRRRLPLAASIVSGLQSPGAWSSVTPPWQAVVTGGVPPVEQKCCLGGRVDAAGGGGPRAEDLALQRARGDPC